MSKSERALERERKRAASRRQLTLWVLTLAALGVCVVALVSILLSGPPEEPETAATVGGQELRSDAELRALLEASPPPESKTPEEETREVIASHRERMEAAPDSEEAPALLNAMGNLYRQRLGDYDAAIQCYEDLLAQYPDWPGIRAAYLNLATAYREQGNLDYLNWTWRRMMEKFPEDSAEYQYAQQQLAP